MTISTQIYLDNAVALGLDLNVYQEFSVIEIKLGKRLYRFEHNITPFNRQSSRWPIEDKYQAVYMLKRAKAPLQSTCIRADGFHKDLPALNHLPYPVSILPPYIYNRPRVNRYNIPDKEALIQILNELFTDYGLVVVEPFRPDYRCYRAIVFYGEVIALIELSAPVLIGDGVSSIAQLFENKTQQRLEHAKLAQYGALKMADHHQESLVAQHLSFESVLEARKKIKVGYQRSPYYDGETKNISVDILPRATKKILKKTAHFAGLNFAGIDFVCKGPRTPLDGRTGFITHLIPDPDISYFESPIYGDGTLVAVRLLKKIIKSGRSSSKLI